MMSTLRKFMIAALVAGAVIAAPATALASTTQTATAQPSAQTASTAHSASVVPARIRRVPCRNYTFNVFSRSRGLTCYEGVGTIRTDIPNVYRITAGENTGRFRISFRTSPELVSFRPLESFTFSPQSHAELLVLQITRT
jgi:hypothetical protein